MTLRFYHPTPWTSDGTYIFDARGDTVYSDDQFYPWCAWDAKGAKEICDAMNAWREKKHADSPPVL